MLKEGRPHLVVVFPTDGENGGARHMAELAADTGTPVEIADHLGGTYTLNDTSTADYEPPEREEMSELINARMHGRWTGRPEDTARDGDPGEARDDGRPKVDMTSFFEAGENAEPARTVETPEAAAATEDDDPEIGDEDRWTPARRTTSPGATRPRTWT